MCSQNAFREAAAGIVNRLHSRRDWILAKSDNSGVVR